VDIAHTVFPPLACPAWPARSGSIAGADGKASNIRRTAMKTMRTPTRWGGAAGADR